MDTARTTCVATWGDDFSSNITHFKVRLRWFCTYFNKSAFYATGSCGYFMAAYLQDLVQNDTCAVLEKCIVTFFLRGINWNDFF